MKTTTDQTEAKIITVPDPDFEPGDPVKISNGRGYYVFRGRRRNVRTGEEWLDLFGGLLTRPGAIRSVKPEIVVPDSRKGCGKKLA